MRAETTSNCFLDKPEQLTDRQISALMEAGWHDPTGTAADSTPENDPDGSPNLFVDFPAPVSFETVANLAVRTLAEILRVPHPGFLQYEAFDAEGDAIPLPKLGLKQVIPTPRPASQEDLSRLLLATLKEATGIETLDYDKDGDIGIGYGSAVAFVRLHEDPPCVRFYSPILREVEESPGLFARLNDINAREPLMRFVCRHGAIYAVADLPAIPFVSGHVAQVLAHFCATADGMDSLMQEEFGGQTALGEPMPSMLKH
jgi:hypothetical protein